MGTWGVAEAKAHFSAVLDKAETEGPQLVTRRKREFYVLTKDQLTELGKLPVKDDKPFVSAWDALRPSSELCFDFDFPRAKGKSRAAKF
jgi:prevent-host-death family protein